MQPLVQERVEIDKDNRVIIHYFGHFKCLIDVAQQRSLFRSFKKTQLLMGQLETFHIFSPFSFLMELLKTSLSTKACECKYAFDVILLVKRAELHKSLLLANIKNNK